MKNFVILFAVCFCANSLTAQHISIGPTVGIGHSWLNSNVTTGDKNLFFPTYNAGVKLVYSIESNWGVSADVKFSSEGGSRGVDGNNKTVDRLNYLRIPIQGIYFFGKYGDKIRPKISIGPSFGFLVGGKEKIYSNGKMVQEFQNENNFNKLDIGLNAAVGANIRICKSTWLNTDLTYYHGLTDISKGASNLKLRGIGINVGLLFPFGGR